MKIRKTTEVIIQTDRVLVLRKRTPSFLVACAECGAALVTPESAALAAGKRTRDIYREVENGQLHFMEMPDGKMLVCCR